MGANLSDVARLAQVSATLISGYLNHPETVRMSEETRRRVAAALRELNYHPKQFACKLRTGSSRMIGVCGLSITNEVGTQEREILFDNLLHRGYRMMQGSSAGDAGLLQDESNLLLSYGCDGLVLRTSRLSLELGKFIEKLDIPAVCITGQRVPEEFQRFCVTYDNAAGMRAAMDHLISLGHREIALIVREWAEFEQGPRAEAFRSYRQGGERIFRFRDREEITPDFVAKIRRENPDCTGWICLNDMTALRVLQCCAEAGIRVPQELSIIGSDDCNVARFAAPALTSIHQPCKEACEAALTLLFNQLKKRSDPFDPHPAATLTIRKSCTTPYKKDIGSVSCAGQARGTSKAIDRTALRDPNDKKSFGQKVR